MSIVSDPNKGHKSPTSRIGVNEIEKQLKFSLAVVMGFETRGRVNEVSKTSSYGGLAMNCIRKNDGLLGKLP